MKLIFTALIASTTIFSCAQTPGNNDNNVKISVGVKTPAGGNEAVATFAEGCFWLQ